MEKTKEMRIDKIREERDVKILDWSTVLYLAVAAVMIIYLAKLELSGKEGTMEAVLCYGSLAVVFIIYVMEYINEYLRIVMCTVRSIIALIIILVISFPVMTLRYGLPGYINFALREARRIGRLERSRWEER